MDLVKEIKSAVKNPATLKSFYVLFVTAFVLLLIPITVLALAYQGTYLAQARDSCAVPIEKTFTGVISEGRDGEHVFVFDGSNCSLTARANSLDDRDISLWLYLPDGNIEFADKNINKSYEFIYAAEPVQKGTYRLAVRLKSGESSNYTATISFR